MSNTPPPAGPSGSSYVCSRPVREVADSAPFRSENPATGEPLEPEFRGATAAMLQDAASGAWRAFTAFGRSSPECRARLLEGIAASLELVRAPLLERACMETGPRLPRLEMEFARTVRTLRSFAALVSDDARRRAAEDQPEPGAAPGSIPAHHTRRLLLPLGPVAVFGASNFPLAYGVAGGDTASALAAGCPVIVKGHPAHPGTGEVAAGAVAHAVRSLDIDPGVFSYLHSGGAGEMDVGRSLVRHPCVRAVGFTGSFKGGMALAREAGERPEPIPVFAEMGSTNPVYICPDASASRAEAIARQLGASILDSSGQQCTCPGLIFCVGAADLESRLQSLLEAAPRNTMLTRRVRDAYRERVQSCLGVPGVESTPTLRDWAARALEGTGPIAAPAGLLTTELANFLETPTLREEIFGPAALVVRCPDEHALLHAADAAPGSLTATIHADDPRGPLTGHLFQAASRRAGRIIFNGVPTGVRVGAGMVHAGPHPATNRPEATAVGPFAIERWTRPVCFQNAPDPLIDAWS